LASKKANIGTIHTGITSSPEKQNKSSAKPCQTLYHSLKKNATETVLNLLLDLSVDWWIRPW